MTFKYPNCYINLCLPVGVHDTSSQPLCKCYDSSTSQMQMEITAYHIVLETCLICQSESHQLSKNEIQKSQQEANLKIIVHRCRNINIKLNQKDVQETCVFTYKIDGCPFLQCLNHCWNNQNQNHHLLHSQLEVLTHLKHSVGV